VKSGEAVRREVIIKARRETVFKYFTDPALMTRWKGRMALLEPRPGGVYRVDMEGAGIIRGEYVEVKPPERVVFTFGWEPGSAIPLPAGSTTVEVELFPHGPGGHETRLVLVHSGLPEDLMGAHGQGWDTHLPKLAEVVAAPGRL
jgi:uncharacterized protein YndB with AHSA1/START domain